MCVCLSGLPWSHAEAVHHDRTRAEPNLWHLKFTHTTARRYTHTNTHMHKQNDSSPSLLLHPLTMTATLCLSDLLCQLRDARNPDGSTELVGPILTHWVNKLQCWLDTHYIYIFYIYIFIFHLSRISKIFNLDMKSAHSNHGCEWRTWDDVTHTVSTSCCGYCCRLFKIDAFE